MAHTAIQNVKILHKRYSASEWLAGKTNAGNTLSLANGELGYDTTNGVLKIGTVDGSTWANAKEVRKQTVEYRYKSGETYVTDAPDTVNTWFISKIEYEKIISGGIDQQCYKLVVYHDDLKAYVDGRIDANVNIPDLKVTDGSATAGEGEIEVVTSIEEGAEHEVVSKKGLAVTKSYVDNKFSAAKTITVADGGTEDDDGASEITYVSGVEQSAADHTITVKKQKLVLPSVEVSGNDATGDYIASVAVDATDDHKIVVTKGTLPTITAGEGSGNGNGATIVGGISVTGHTITAAKKTIKGDGKVISVVGTNADITISADTYTKAEIDTMHEELAKAMEFAGTLGTTEGAIASLPAASSNNHGSVYKVTTAGTYNGQVAKVGDLFISDGSKWRYVPSGDESFTDTWRAIKVEGTQVKSNEIGTGAIDFVAATPNAGTTDEGIVIANDGDEIQIAHADTSDVEDASRIKLEVIDSLEFDGYGHVQNYLKKKFVAGANVQLIEDEAGNLTISATDTIVTDTNTAHTHTAGQGLDIAGEGGIDGSVQYAHKSIPTADAPQTAKTITAGSADNKFTVVEGYTADGMGHITEVKTREISVNIPVVEDKDTTYDISASANGSTKADINLTAGGSGSGIDKVSVVAGDGLGIKVSGDEITLSGKVAADILGMIKAHLVTAGEANAEAATLPSIDNSVTDRFYQVNVKADGTAFVQVPWKNTEYTASNGVTIVGTDVQHSVSGDANKAVDMYAFGTDAYGHVTGAVAVTTLDGNVD